MITSLVLLSGGLATRLRPISHKIPKALVDINGIPFIEYQLELLRSQGIKEVVICVGYLGEQIEKAIGNGSKFGLDIKYSYDGDNLLGTAGAIKKALPLLPDIFFIMYGDSYLPINFKEVSDFFEMNKYDSLMTVFKNENGFGNNVIYDGFKITKYDKKNIIPEMKFIDYGLEIMNKKCFNDFENEEVLDLAKIHTKLANEGKLLGFEVKKRFYEVGSFEGIEDFRKYINK